MTIQISPRIYLNIAKLIISLVFGYGATLREWIEFFSRKEGKLTSQGREWLLIIKTWIFVFASMLLITTGELISDFRNECF